jgi:hypothetical protein
MTKDPAIEMAGLKGVSCRQRLNNPQAGLGANRKRQPLVKLGFIHFYPCSSRDLKSQNGTFVFAGIAYNLEEVAYSV